MAYFGTLCSPFEMDEWVAETGIRPDMPMIFEHWDQQRPLDYVFAKARSLGFTRMVLTWEPWTPTAYGIGNAAQGAYQPQWGNDTIAAGQHDAYIRLISRNIRESGLERVYIRWGHEFNGDWYPWHTTPETYVAAFKRIVNAFRGGGTSNAKFVWAPSSSLYMDPVAFLDRLFSYWPGKNYVDYTGLTMINLGGDKDRPMSQFIDRFELMRRVFGKPLFASEVNCAWSIKEPYFTGIRDWVKTNNLLSGLVLSQPPISAAQRNNQTDENMEWTIADDPVTLDCVEDIAAALRMSPLT